MLFLSDSEGTVVACSSPMAGQDRDTFQIEAHFAEMMDLLEAAGIPTDGPLLNADAGFDRSGEPCREAQKSLSSQIHSAQFRAGQAVEGL